MLSNGYRSIPEIHYTIYIIWCLLGYICSCFLHTLDRLVRGYKLSRFCTLPRKSRRFIAREQKLVYSIQLNVLWQIFLFYKNVDIKFSMHNTFLENSLSGTLKTKIFESQLHNVINSGMYYSSPPLIRPLFL